MILPIIKNAATIKANRTEKGVKKKTDNRTSK